MVTSNSQSDESLAWDRVGQFLENTGTLGQRIWQRGMGVWGQVSDHMSNGRYTADDMAADTAHAMMTLQNNFADVWTTLTRPPQRQRYVEALPTAFLFFDRPKQGGGHTLLDPVFIPVAPSDTRQLPPEALIALDGTSAESDKGKTSQHGVNALLARLSAHLDTHRRYKLETLRVPDADLPDLVGGVYDGLVYLRDPALPLANVRVIVEGPPPVV